MIDDERIAELPDDDYAMKHFTVDELLSIRGDDARSYLKIAAERFWTSHNAHHTA